MLNLIYNALALSFLLLASPYFLLRMLITPRFHRGLRERLGFYPSRPAPSDSIWVQAASVGEVAAAIPLIRRLAENPEGRGVVVTCQTAAGREAARKSLAGVAEVVLTPLDLGLTIGRFIRSHSPTVLILIETELWPGLILACARNGIPIAICNGRISDRSFPRYRAAGFLLRPLLTRISLLAMRSRTDAERIIRLGAPKQRTLVTGNIKYDSISPVDEGRRRDLARRLGLSRESLVIVGGSTAAGEELLLARSWKILKGKLPDLRLILAPRHLERLPRLLEELKEAGFAPVRLSRLSPGTIPELVVVDALGVLYSLYSLADAVFVGRSLCGQGGQNPIEPAYLEKAIIFGTGMHNFREDADGLLEVGGAMLIENSGELPEKLGHLLAHPELRERMGKAARKMADSRRGATEKNFKLIAALIRKKQGRKL